MTTDQNLETRAARIEQQLHVLEGDLSIAAADLSVLQRDVTDLRVDIKVLLITGASKTDLERARTSIIVWTLSALLLAQWLPILLNAYGQ